MAEPLYVTRAGRVVLYRAPGDRWNVARDQQEADELLALGVAERAWRGYEIVLARVEPVVPKAPQAEPKGVARNLFRHRPGC